MKRKKEGTIERDTKLKEEFDYVSMLQKRQQWRERDPEREHSLNQEDEYKDG